MSLVTSLKNTTGIYQRFMGEKPTPTLYDTDISRYQTTFATKEEPHNVLHYLNDEDLTKDFDGTIGNDFATSFNCYASLFVIDKTPQPFIKFLCVKNKDTFSFPSQQVDVAIGGNIQTEIMNATITVIEDLFETYGEIDFSNIFKGFIWNEPTQSVWLFFDMTEWVNGNRDLSTTPPTWVILNEILNIVSTNTKTVCGIPLLPELVEIFNNNKCLHKLKRNTFETLENPVIMYLCEYKSGWKLKEEHATQVSVGVGVGLGLVDENKQSLSADDALSLFFSNNLSPIPPPTQHPIFEIHHFFTEQPLDFSWESVSSVSSSVSRYVIFKKINAINNENKYEQIEGENHIAKDVSGITDEQLKNYFEKVDKSAICTLFFKDNNIPIWCIKYPSQFTKI